MSITPREPADFTPERGNYTELKPFRFWCQKVLPLVYDDSLSYYELLCKVVDFLNKTMEDVETLEGDVTGLHTAYVELQTYVNEYFSTLDVQEEIDNKLDEMAESGALTELIIPLLPDLISAWLSEHLTPTTPVIDDTLTIRGAGADSKTVGDKIKEIWEKMSQSSVYGLGDNAFINFRPDVHIVEFPVGTFIRYKNVSKPVLSGTTVDGSDVINNDAFLICVDDSGNIIPRAWTATLNNESVLGYVYKNHVFINGVSKDNITTYGMTLSDESWVGISDSSKITFNPTEKSIVIPAGNFAKYKNITRGLTNQITIDASSISGNAYYIVLTKDFNFYATDWNTQLTRVASDEIIGYAYGKNLFLNGVDRERINVVGSSNSPTCMVCPTNLLKISYNATTHIVTIPVGTILRYKNTTSVVTGSPITIDATNVINSGAFCIAMRADTSLYAVAWNTTTLENDTDVIIGYVFGSHIYLLGVNKYQTSISGTGVNESQNCYIGLADGQKVVYNSSNYRLTIPAGCFIRYKNTFNGVPSSITVDGSSVVNAGAFNIVMKANRTLYANAWNNDYLQDNQDVIIGYVYGKNVYINGVNEYQIVVNKKTFYCFGDSLVAGVNTSKAFHMVWHDKTGHSLLNYGIGSTGYITEATGTVVVGGGREGIGTGQSVSGDNTVVENMQTVLNSLSSVDGIIIFSGTNDFGTNKTIANFTSAVESAIQYALTKTKYVLVISPVNRELVTNSLNLTMNDYRTAIENVCKAYGIPYADGGNVGLNPSNAKNKTDFVPDGLHPNNDGQYRIATCFLEKFKEAMII